MAFDFVTPLFCIGVVLLARKIILAQKNIEKWKFLRAVKKLEEDEHRASCGDERIREVNDRMQQGRVITLKSGSGSDGAPSMTDQPQVNEPNPPRSIVWYACLGAIAGFVMLAVLSAIGGLTGFLRTEYRTTPGQHAIILALGWSCYGMVYGTFMGLLIGCLRRYSALRDR